MKNPVHNIKIYAENNIPCPELTWYKSAPHWYQNSARGWIGSGVVDRTGKEIYEGDVVILGNQRGVVRFENAHFYIDRDAVVDSDAPEDEVVPFTLNCLCSPFIKIVGHIAETEQHD